jgi:hypothetical protein
MIMMVASPWINKLVLIILLKVQQGKGKIVKILWLYMAAYENQKRHKVCFLRKFNFQKQECIYINESFF